MTNGKAPFLIIIVHVLLLAFSSCKSTKNTAMHRGWHNMNSRYNGYFYARENTKETLKLIEKEHKDDFTKLLPIFIIPSEENAKNYAASFEKTIEKASTVIQRHAITNPKTKEEIPNACKWIDENYMLIGQAEFYNRNYIPAQEIFTYVSQKYEHPEAIYAGLIWTIFTNNALGSLSLSEPIIDEIRNAEDFPKDKNYQREFAAVTADYYIKRMNYESAIQSLNEAIAITKKKTLKARYIFILAQLYEEIGDRTNALANYVLVPGLHPNYEMAFTAKINQAKLYDSNSENSKAIKKELMKMLKDSKNKEYLDQLYYALAQIVYKENDIPLAIEYLNKSVENSISNNDQKAISFLNLGDIYFDQTKYEFAEANYDSTLIYLSAEHPDYEKIVIKKNSLNELVVNLKVIAHQDSLLVLSKMSEKDRRKAVQAIMDNLLKEKEQKEALRQQQLLSQQNANQNQLITPAGPLAGSGAWYFYNPTMVSLGKAEFIKKWGDRVLENNWRRSEKANEDFTDLDTGKTPGTDSIPTASDSSIAASSSASNNAIDDTSYLKNIPLTEDAIAGSNNKIIEAYYRVGSIYKEELSNNRKSVQAFEELLSRYPENKHKLSTYYQLYRTYLTMNNNAKAEYYKNLLLKDYPDSEYSKIIKNPEYGKNTMANKDKTEKFYQETYQMYLDQKYSEVIARCNQMESTSANNHLMPQFNLLKALSIGKTKDVVSFENALIDVIAKHPNTPSKTKAEEILTLIESKKVVAPIAPVISDSMNTLDSLLTDSLKTEPGFIYKEEGDYYWMVIVENDTAGFELFKGKMKEANTNNFKILKLKLITAVLDTNHQVLTLQAFDGKDKALSFYDLFKSSNKIFDDLKKENYKIYVISKANYALLLQNKKVDAYEQFFLKNIKK